jgi:hypothetical protein
MKIQTLRRAALVVFAATLLSFVVDATAQAGGVRQPRPRNDIFYNYYVGPGAAGGVPAQMYISPRPTPPFVGHTWITYQPLMPNEFLYKHHRTYRRYDPVNGGATFTRVLWW